MVKPNAKTRNSRLSKIQLQWISPPRDRPWVKIPVDVIEGEAWRSLGVNERRFLDALMCQHFRYCQKSNGELELTQGAFLRAGITAGRYVASARSRLEELRLIACKQVPNPDYIRPKTLYEILFYRETKGLQEEAKRRFVWATVEVMESPAWCALSINSRRVLDRLLIEHMRHRNEHNGYLRVSYEQFIGQGIYKNSLISSALEELVEADLLEVTKSPRMGEFKGPNLYRLTFHGTLDGPPTWKPPPVIIPLPRTPKRPSFKSILADGFKLKEAAND
jgi:hypothetical protein